MRTVLKQQIQILILLLVQFLFLVFTITKIDIAIWYLMLVFFILNCFIMFWIFTVNKVFKPRTDIHALESKDLSHLLEFGAFSILEYDENYNIVNITGLLKENHASLLNKKLSNIDSRFNEFLLQDNARLNVSIDTHHYEVELLTQEKVLIFKNVDELVDLKQFKSDNQITIGLLQIDNYNYTVGYIDERELSEVSALLRKMINDWAFQHGILLRRLREDRYFLITNYKYLENIKQSINTFLKEFKDNADNLEVNVTASIVFAYGNSNVNSLDIKINELLELAQARGGDQMIIQDINGKMEYFGGNSEATITKSNTRTRIIAQSIIDLMNESKKIFVFGHQMMDFDSMGSCIAISKLAMTNNKEVYIVSESGGIESKLGNALKEYAPLLKHHKFISDAQASLLYEEDDLVILVDHHNPNHSAAMELQEIAKNKIVIDHHRRGSEYVSNPILSYLEAGASSVCEMMVEILQVNKDKVSLSKEEAMIIYTGIVVDTNFFTARTNTKTFEACAYLKECGIDVGQVREILGETIEEFKMKAKLLEAAYQYHDVMIAPLKQNEIVSRTLLSQIADQLIEIQGLNAAFAIGYIAENKVAISARSNKNMNVQMIMEKMDGGGHFNAAAVQINDTTVETVEARLIEILEMRE